ncbi:MAG: hypothetical protein KDA75_17540, partial [Planctomycetaceae bacterium]|nr:hypothetical protein [Planctomycetaceae bacterium]
VVLALQYAVIHSLLLAPSVRKRLTRWIPKPLYGCFFCVSTCVTLLLTFACWSSSGPVLYVATGWPRTLITMCFSLSWVALFYSLALSGIGYQTGLTPWWYWLRRRPLPPRGFQERGAYRLFRHPIYLSFLGLIWFTPRMTLDHALLTGLWTAYIFIGSVLKDERLAFYLGETYRDYQRRVRGYPLVFWGPLGRRFDQTPVSGSRSAEAAADHAPQRQAA